MILSRRPCLLSFCLIFASCHYFSFFDAVTAYFKVFLGNFGINCQKIPNNSRVWPCSAVLALISTQFLFLFIISWFLLPGEQIRWIVLHVLRFDWTPFPFDIIEIWYKIIILHLKLIKKKKEIKSHKIPLAIN